MKARIEGEAWKAAPSAGVELPQELTRVWARIEEVQAELEALNADRAAVVAAESEIMAGQSVAAAVDAARSSQAYVELLEARRRAAAGAVRMLNDKAAQWIAEHRDLLITEHLRPVVAAILRDAAPLVRPLQDFVPAFDSDEILENATPAQLKAYRQSRELSDRLTVCQHAWLSSWWAATGSAATTHRIAGYLRPDAPGGLHVWERPEAVTDPDVRDGRTTDVLAIALHADAAYRLAGGQEMLDLTAATPTMRPWLAGEKQARQVLVPERRTAEAEPAKKQTGRAAFVS